MMTKSVRHKSHVRNYKAFSLVNLQYCQDQRITQMEPIKQEAKLSFSIENILRDDFSKKAKRLPSCSNLSTDPYKFGSAARCWPASAPLLKCYAVRYNPVFLRLLPNAQRMGSRLHQVNRVKELILSQHPHRLEEDRLHCEDEEKYHERQADHRPEGESYFLHFFKRY